MSVLAWTARLAVILPALAAAAGALLARGSRDRAAAFAVAGSAGALVVTLVERLAVVGGRSVTSVPLLGPVPTGAVESHLDLRADELSATVAVAVALVALCVQVYSVAYLAHDRRYPSYAAGVSLFTAAMLLVVQADDLLLLLIGWEVMGLCSYLLVGHDSEREAARAAAVKAFLVTRVADVGFVLGIVVLLVGAGTSSISQLLDPAFRVGVPHGVWTAAGVLLVIGVLGKSAQLPLHSWLPDAMEGPTPVSALIHAATMVAAGSYVVARLLPVMELAPAARQLLAVVAAVSMLAAALAAVVQSDLKRLLAYSTISQVAYMLGGLAVAPADRGSAPGIAHLLTHAAFKAVLFLAAGALAHEIGSTALAGLGGAWRRSRLVAGVLTLGLAALAGVPPLSGFWSKEAVLGAAEEATTGGGLVWAGWLVLVSGLVTGLVTAAYATRAWWLVVPGPVRVPETLPQTPAPPAAAPGPPVTAEAAPAVHALPRLMTWPLVVLTVPAVFGGVVLLAPAGGTVRVGAGTAALATALTLVGIGLGALGARRLPGRDIALAVPARVRGLLASGYAIDAVQDRLVVRPVRALARVVVAGDRDVVDAYVRGSAVGTRWLGAAARRAQTGRAPQYLAWLLAGAVAIGLWAVVSAGGMS